jgi:hypothetical protein
MPARLMGTEPVSRVGEHVLQELLADEHRAHQRTEHDDPGARRDPERGTGSDLEVVERVRGAALTQSEQNEADDRDRARTSVSVLLLGTGAKLIERISAATRISDSTPPTLSTGSVPSLTCAGTKRPAM